MPKRSIGINVLEAAKRRVKQTFEEFEMVYVSFSGGKDSTVMIHLVADEAKRINRRFGLLIVDLEGQYKLTIEHLQETVNQYSDIMDVYWVCLPISLRNAVSVFEPKWICWDEERKDDWIRTPPDGAITDHKYFDFFVPGMEFEEFVPLFGEWYSKGKNCACHVGIRTDESLNRFRTISSKTKQKYKGFQWTTKVTDNVYNVYPIYDWRTDDIWIYHAKNAGKRWNELYDRMHMAGLSIHQMRICQPYGDDQRRGLWLFHLIEPTTWAKVVARVSGANSGALYVQDTGNINGYHKITCPDGHTWKSFASLIIATLPPKTKEHFENKILLFVRWWKDRGYSPDIPDEAPLELETKRDVPSWRRICKSLLRNDYWCKGLGFSQHKSKAYEKYMTLMRKRKDEWQQSLF
jgi:predicted phosphoadenosine phosphosulfate sulfurtransferase